MGLALSALVGACSSSGGVATPGSGGGSGATASGGMGSAGFPAVGGSSGVGGAGGASGGSAGTGGSGGTPLACDPGFKFSKNPVTAGVPFQVRYTAKTAYTYIGMKVTGPGSPQVENQQITGTGPYTWTYTVSGHGAGVLSLTFVDGMTGGNPGNPIATCQVQSVAGSGTGGSGGIGGAGGTTGTGGSGGTPSQGFVTSNGTRFSRNGKNYRFVGANVRGITHYGHNDALPYSTASQIELNLSDVQGMNGKVIRAFVAYNGIGATETGNRLGAVLDAAETHNITVIVALTDFYGATPFHPKGDDGYYAKDLNGYTVLDHAFFASGYQQNYKPQVLALVQRFKNHPAIFAWELGNEIRDATFSNSSPATFTAFCKDMASAIHAADPNHMIAVGEISAMAGSGMTQAQAQTLYGDPDISFLTIRSYDGTSYDDTSFAASLGKPIIVEEAGFDSSKYSDRPSATAGDLSKWFGKGVRGYLQWGYMPSATDNGDGDGIHGMDKAIHNDWDGLYSTYKSFGATL